MPSPKKPHPAGAAPPAIAPSKTSHLFAPRKANDRTPVTREAIEADMEAFRRAGGKIEVQKFATPADFAALPDALIFNCTGLGSRDLFGDQELEPRRGQLAILEPQPNIRYAVLGEFGYMFPRADGILLGGTYERDVWDPTPQPADINRIIASQKRFFESFRCNA